MTATETAAPEPNPATSGIVEVTRRLKAGGFEMLRAESVSTTALAIASSRGSLASELSRSMSGAVIWTPPGSPRMSGVMTARAWTWETGTAIAG